MKGLSSSSSQPLSPRERLATRIPQVFLRHRDYPFEGMSHPTPHVRLRCMPGTNVRGQHVHWGPLRRRGPVGQRTFSSNFAENRSAEFCGEPTWKGQHVFLTLGFCLEVIVEIVASNSTGDTSLQAWCEISWPLQESADTCNCSYQPASLINPDLGVKDHRISTG